MKKLILILGLILAPLLASGQGQVSAGNNVGAPSDTNSSSTTTLTNKTFDTQSNTFKYDGIQIGQAITGTGGTSYGQILPITFFVKSVTVLTSGTPADIATITLPSWLTRWRLAGTSFSVSFNTFVAETASGTLASGAVEGHDASGGGGNTILSSTALPAGAGQGTGWAASSATIISSSGTIYIRQTSNSANAGTVSFYVTVMPLP